MWTRGLTKFSTFAVVKTYSKQLKDFLLQGSHRLNGVKIYARVYFSENEKDLYLKDMNERRFKVHGIPSQINDDILKLVLQFFFDVEKVYSISQANGKFQGQGFIVFWNKTEADRALKLHDRDGYLKLEVTDEILSDVITTYDPNLSKAELHKVFEEMRITFPPQ